MGGAIAKVTPPSGLALIRDLHWPFVQCDGSLERAVVIELFEVRGYPVARDAKRFAAPRLACDVRELNLAEMRSANLLQALEDLFSTIRGYVENTVPGHRVAMLLRPSLVVIDVKLAVWPIKKLRERGG